MSVVSFGGLASGLDTASIVQKLLAIRHQPIDRMQSRIAGLNTRKAAIEGIESRVKDLLAAAQALDTPDEFNSLAATSSDESLLTASTGTSATGGSYDVVIQSLAAAQKERSQGFDTVSDSVGTGTFSITVGGTTTDITMVDGSSSLADLKDAINNSDAGVHATILYDGSETGGYHLLLTADDTGTEAAFSVDATGLSNGTAPAFTTITAAANAQLTIDGLTINSQSNSIANAIDGVTLELAGADANTTVKLDVTADPEQVRDKVQTFVDSYNALMDYAADQTGKGDTLQSDGTTRSVISQIRTGITSSLSDGPLTMLFQVGIEVTRDGKIEFKTDTFDQQLAADPGAVRDLFVEQGAHQGIVSRLAGTLDTLTDSVDGSFKCGKDAIDDQVEYLNDTIDRYQRSLDGYEKYLNAKFTAMEDLISTLQSQSGFMTSMMTSSR